MLGWIVLLDHPLKFENYVPLPTNHLKRPMFDFGFTFKYQHNCSFRLLLHCVLVLYVKKIYRSVGTRHSNLSLTIREEEVYLPDGLRVRGAAVNAVEVVSVRRAAAVARAQAVRPVR